MMREAGLSDMSACNSVDAFVRRHQKAWTKVELKSADIFNSHRLTENQADRAACTHIARLTFKQDKIVKEREERVMAMTQKPEIIFKGKLLPVKE
jgi:hypothetical protein